MASAGPNSGGTFASDNAVGGFAWTNPGNAAASDNTYATTGNYGGSLYYLKATNFGFAIPAGATINGIVAEVERAKISGNNSLDNSVRLYKAGSLAGSNYASGSNWPTSDAYATYGGAADLWGTTWTADDINHAGFGIGVSVKMAPGKGSSSARIDHIRVTVHYTAAAVPTAPSPPARLSLRLGLGF